MNTTDTVERVATRTRPGNDRLPRVRSALRIVTRPVAGMATCRHDNDMEV